MLAHQINWILSKETVFKIENLFEAIELGHLKPGKHLRQSLDDAALSSLAFEDKLRLVVNTKVPRIFAESEIRGDGTDWSQEELSILGDVSVGLPVEIFDDGHHANPTVYETPFQGFLVFTSGALLRSGFGKPCDWDECVNGTAFNFDGFKSLYTRRLLPVLLHINEIAKERQRTAFISVPGIGCGQFAGKFQGQLGTQLLNVLKTLLHEFVAKLPNVGYIYYDPYVECLPIELAFEHLRLIVRPLLHSYDLGRPQLTKPENHILPVPIKDVAFFSLVAWDHASWPGNDFYAGLRATDDGVKAAATDSMKLITGVKGTYDESKHVYTPPRGNKTWEEVVRSSELALCSKSALIRVYS